jgi:hypothetical protein
LSRRQLLFSKKHTQVSKNRLRVSKSLMQLSRSHLRLSKSLLRNTIKPIAGMYLYALIADGEVIDTKRMILTK